MTPSATRTTRTRTRDKHRDKEQEKRDTDGHRPIDPDIGREPKPGKRGQ